jgi:hypothetical protein
MKVTYCKKCNKPHRLMTPMGTLSIDSGQWCRCD